LNVGTIPSWNWIQKLDPKELKKIYLKLKNEKSFCQKQKGALPLIQLPRIVHEPSKNWLCSKKKIEKGI